MDASTPELIIACAQGRHIPRARFSFFRMGRRAHTYYTVTLRDVFISQVDQVAKTQNEDNLICEEVQLHYSVAEWEYVSTTQGREGEICGSKVVGWDQRSNTEVF